MIHHIKIGDAEYAYQTLIDSKDGWGELVGKQEDGIICLKSNQTAPLMIIMEADDRISIIESTDKISHTTIEKEHGNQY